jgi:cyclopropane-fatty-acyl-phospholipid synthase
MKAAQVHIDRARLSRREAALLRLLERSGASGEIELPCGIVHQIGATAPRFRVHLRSSRALAGGFSELDLARAYVEGEFDIEGDMLALLDVRSSLLDRAPLVARLQFLLNFFSPPAWVNRRAIGHHYTLGNDFYLSFIDQRYRFYSHCVYRADSESLEEAAEHKLEQMVAAVRLQPGMRLLDIGAGWGGVTEYCGSRGVDVTSLTLVDDSKNYIENLIHKRNLPGRVLLEDVLKHRPAEPYDAAVIYGVIEHIPNYRRFLRVLWDALKPGARLYLDASATKEKFDMSAFTRHYIWHGTHTFLSLQDLIQEALFNGFELIQVKNETRDYELTIKAWAERLDAKHEALAERWGEPLYRAFRTYLWGGCHAFRHRTLQAYHLVVERCPEPGPRPGLCRRALHFLRSLR